MKPYNGHRSWNAWNIQLWLTSDYETYCYCRDLVQLYGLNNAVNRLTKETAGRSTPDGAKFNRLSIKLALQDME
jgi:hypothetical protein